MNWNLLLDQSDLASLLPPEYAEFARPITDALGVFLQGLPEKHQTAILAEQGGLPPQTSFAERLRRLAYHCPVLQKLGQILARDQRLPLELRSQLQQLESLPASIPHNVIQRMLEAELGNLDRLETALTPPAIAEASVAVVIPFRHRQYGDGVFKVLKPGIEERLNLELQLLGQVGSYLDERCDDLHIPHLDYEESFQLVKEKLCEETRLDLEQRHLAQARQFYADDPNVQIPRVMEFCTPRVTAMERIRGCKITDHQLDIHHDKRRLARLVAHALITKPILSSEPLAMFHGDPHAGNLFYTVDGRLAILDWSLVGSLGERERIAIVQIILAALTLHPGRVTKTLSTLAVAGKIDHSALETVVNRWLKRIRHGQFPTLTWLVGFLDDAVRNARLRLTADLMLFRKSLHTLEGILTDVGDAQIDESLCVEFLLQFLAEWPQRWFSRPNSRRFATRLSNFDLTRTMLSCPATVTRFWMGHVLDVLPSGFFSPCVSKGPFSMQAPNCFQE